MPGSLRPPSRVSEGAGTCPPPTRRVQQRQAHLTLLSSRVRQADKQTKSSLSHPSIQPSILSSQASVRPFINRKEGRKEKRWEKGGAVGTKEERMARRKLNVKEACLLLMERFEGWRDGGREDERTRGRQATDGRRRGSPSEAARGWGGWRGLAGKL